MQIFVRLLDGKTMTLEVRGETTVRAVKRQIKEAQGLPMGFQRLIWAGKQLGDEQTLQQLGVGKESTLHLVGRLTYDQVFVEHPDGTDEYYRWEGSFAQLRRRIEERHGLAPQRQLLHQGGRLVDDADSLEDYCRPNTLGVLFALAVV